MTTGLRDASVLQLPTTWSTTDRTILMQHLKEVQIAPLQPHQFASSHPCQRVANNHRPFPKFQLIEQTMQFRYLE